MQKQTKRQVTSLLTTLLFVFTQFSPLPAFAAGQASPEVKLPSEFQLNLPPDLGTIQNLVTGTGPTLIHIQDAHGNYEAQKKIQEILQYLNQSYGVKLLLLEGSAFKLKPELIRLFPAHPEITKEVLDGLAKASFAQGEELFLAETADVEAYGIENLDAYLANSTAFKVVITEQEKTEGFIQDMDRQIESLTGPYLNKDLRAFLKRTEDFDEKRLSLMDWITYLKIQAKGVLQIDLNDPAYQINWPMLERIYKLAEFETAIDMKALAGEQVKFLEAIHSIASEIYQEIEKLLSAPVSRHELPDPETELLFEDMVAALPADFNYDAYPNVKRFIAHLILQSEVKGERLMGEMSRLTDFISEKSAKTPVEKKILTLLRDHRLLKKLFALELTPEDYEQVLKRGTDLRPSGVTQKFLELNKTKRIRDVEFGHTDEIDSLFDKALEFYAGAKARDGSMTENILARMKEQGADKAVVITGGFHAEPFKNFFQKEGFNYALIAPKIETAEGREAYLKSILQYSTLKPVQKLGFDSPDLAAQGVNPGLVNVGILAEASRVSALRGVDLNSLLNESVRFTGTEMKREKGANGEDGFAVKFTDGSSYWLGSKVVQTEKVVVDSNQVSVRSEARANPKIRRLRVERLEDRKLLTGNDNDNNSVAPLRESHLLAETAQVSPSVVQTVTDSDIISNTTTPAYHNTDFSFVSVSNATETQIYLKNVNTGEQTFVATAVSGQTVGPMDVNPAGTHAFVNILRRETTSSGYTDTGDVLVFDMTQKKIVQVENVESSGLATIQGRVVDKYEFQNGLVLFNSTISSFTQAIVTSHAGNVLNLNTATPRHTKTFTSVNLGSEVFTPQKDKLIFGGELHGPGNNAIGIYDVATGAFAYQQLPNFGFGGIKAISADGSQAIVASDVNTVYIVSLHDLTKVTQTVNIPVPDGKGPTDSSLVQARHLTPTTVELSVQDGRVFKLDTSTLSLNDISSLDTNEDGLVTPIDALRVANSINANSQYSPSLDANEDGKVTPEDFYAVTNYLNHEEHIVTPSNFKYYYRVRNGTHGGYPASFYDIFTDGTLVASPIKISYFPNIRGGTTEAIAPDVSPDETAAVTAQFSTPFDNTPPHQYLAVYYLKIGEVITRPQLIPLPSEDRAVKVQYSGPTTALVTFASGKTQEVEIPTPPVTDQALAELDLEGENLKGLAEEISTRSEARIVTHGQLLKNLELRLASLSRYHDQLESLLREKESQPQRPLENDVRKVNSEKIDTRLSEIEGIGEDIDLVDQMIGQISHNISDLKVAIAKRESLGDEEISAIRDLVRAANELEHDLASFRFPSRSEARARDEVFEAERLSALAKRRGFYNPSQEKIALSNATMTEADILRSTLNAKSLQPPTSTNPSQEKIALSNTVMTGATVLRNTDNNDSVRPHLPISQRSEARSIETEPTLESRIKEVLARMIGATIGTVIIKVFVDNVSVAPDGFVFKNGKKDPDFDRIQERLIEKVASQIGGPSQHFEINVKNNVLHITTRSEARASYKKKLIETLREAFEYAKWLQESRSRMADVRIQDSAHWDQNTSNRIDELDTERSNAAIEKAVFREALRYVRNPVRRNPKLENAVRYVSKKTSYSKDLIRPILNRVFAPRSEPRTGQDQARKKLEAALVMIGRAGLSKDNFLTLQRITDIANKLPAYNSRAFSKGLLNGKYEGNLKENSLLSLDSLQRTPANPSFITKYLKLDESTHTYKVDLFRKFSPDEILVRWTYSYIWGNEPPVYKESLSSITPQKFIEMIADFLRAFPNETGVQQTRELIEKAEKWIGTSRSEARDIQGQMEKEVENLLAAKTLQERGEVAQHLLQLVAPAGSENVPVLAAVLRGQRNNFANIPDSEEFRLLAAMGRIALVNRPYHFRPTPVNTSSLHSNSTQRVRDTLSLGLLRNITVFGRPMVQNGQLIGQGNSLQSVVDNTVQIINKTILDETPRRTEKFIGAPSYIAIWTQGYESFTISASRSETRVAAREIAPRVNVNRPVKRPELSRRDFVKGTPVPLPLRTIVRLLGFFVPTRFGPEDVAEIFEAVASRPVFASEVAVPVMAGPDSFQEMVGTASEVTIKPTEEYLREVVTQFSSVTAEQLRGIVLDGARLDKLTEKTERLLNLFRILDAINGATDNKKPLIVLVGDKKEMVNRLKDVLTNQNSGIMDVEDRAVASEFARRINQFVTVLEPQTGEPFSQTLNRYVDANPGTGALLSQDVEGLKVDVSFVAEGAKIAKEEDAVPFMVRNLLQGLAQISGSKVENPEERARDLIEAALIKDLGIVVSVVPHGNQAVIMIESLARFVESLRSQLRIQVAA